MVKTTVNTYRQLAPVLFGKGAITQSGDVVTELGCKKAIIITDEGINALGYPQKVEASLKEKGIECVIWPGAGSECGADALRNGVKFCKEYGADVMIGIGGGSCMDMAKAMAVLSVNDVEEILKNFVIYLTGQATYPVTPAKIICIPTTSGTGSESTFVTVIANEYFGGAKVGLMAPPSYGIIDPELMVGSPARTTAWCGMDAFAHASESLLNIRDTHHSDLFAHEAIRLITKYLPIACADTNDYEAREQLAWAANLAGMSFSETNCNLGHAIAQAAGGLYHIPHGLCCGSVTGGYLEFAAKEFPGVVRRIGVCMGLDCIDIPDDQIGIYVGRAHRRLMKQVNMTSLGEFTGKSLEEVIDPVVDEVLKMTDPLAADYRGFTGTYKREDIAAIVTKMWNWADLDDSFTVLSK